MADDKQETVLVDGVFFNKPRENAPDFVKGSISIHEKFIPFMKEHRNESGYVNADLLESKAGKLYFKLNTWTPKKEEDDGDDF